MAVSVVMPALEMAQETGKLIAWLKREGETVRKGEMLLEIETDKAVVEVEAAADGILTGVTATAGDVVPVGQTIAWLVAAGEAAPSPHRTPAQSGRKMEAAAAASSTEVSTASATAPPLTPPSPAPPQGAAAAARISPKARKLAREHGVDLALVTGSGSGGEIVAEDILRAASAATPLNPLTDPNVPLSSIARLMAERTAQSWTTVPHFFVAREVDASGLNAARVRMIPAVQQSHGVKVTHTDLVVAAVARSLRDHPRMNASWAAGTIAVNRHVNVALAIAVDGAVVTAVIRDADRISLGDLAKQRTGLAARARANRLQPADITGATFTISNLGMFDVDAFTAIIVPPQAGILAVGAIADRATVVDGAIAIRPMMTLTLSSDHRVIDGAGAAAFLNDVVIALREPRKWL